MLMNHLIMSLFFGGLSKSFDTSSTEPSQVCPLVFSSQTPKLSMAITDKA